VLIGIPLLLWLLTLAPPALTQQAAPVVAESRTAGNAGVAALAARLDSSRHYLLQIDGPPGVPFTARYLSVHVGRSPDPSQTGNDDGSFDATTPYEQELVAPRSDLLYWRYSIVVDPQQPAQLAVRIIDLGPR
jgi:hypothetical protein